MKKSIFALLGLGAACAACCLPFVAPLLVSVGLWGVLATTIGGISVDYVICVWGPWIAAAGLVAFVILRIRRRSKAGCDCKSTCVPGEC